MGIASWKPDVRLTCPRGLSFALLPRRVGGPKMGSIFIVLRLSKGVLRNLRLAQALLRWTYPQPRYTHP